MSPVLESNAVLTRSEEGEWQRIGTGVTMKALRSHPASGSSSALLKFEPGASFPAHNHPGGEEVYVLEGDVRLGHYVLHRGDYLYTPPGGKHAASSRNGCLLLVSNPEPIELLVETLE